MKEVTIRRATEDDVPELVRQRKLMFESMGYDDHNKLQSTSILSRNYFLDGLKNNKFQGWIAVTKEGRIVSNAGVIIDYHPPGPNNLTGKIAYIFNLYTHKEFRRQGIAKKIMETILEWVKSEGISIASLHVTDDGEKLYKGLGFSVENTMRLKIEKESE
ncbi:MAG: GNAT family N-acetyltransferase [Candidatus Heimdallarchaeaceae archaeon]|jgi:ribosomal protein S18 acetylase RimI-like enzyme